MKSKRTVEDLAQDLYKFIESKSQNNYYEDNKWKLHYENVMRQLEVEIQSYNEIIEDYTENKLTINKVEAEGFKRCLITMVNRFRDDEKYM